MDFVTRTTIFFFFSCYLLTVSSSSLALAQGSASVFFIDSSTHRFLRNPSSNHVVKPDSMSFPEVSAAVSVLLGFAPSAAVSAASSAKLNEVLVPNPFNRPRAVFVLGVLGVSDPTLVVKGNAMFSSAYETKIEFGSDKADIELLDKSEVSVFSLDEQSAEECTRNEISDFASWMGGSYVADSLEALNGELSIPLPNGDNFKLHMSKEADRKFTSNLLVLIRNFKRAMEVHEYLLQSVNSPAELLTGCFDGIKVLQEKYGSEGVAQHGAQLLVATLSKIFESLGHAYKGQIVGAIIFSEVAPVESAKMLNVMFTSRPSARSLEESEISPKRIVEVLLVRTILAWLTGIILIIATLLGVYFLLNMSVTRDTLLYSNVKLD